MCKVSHVYNEMFSAFERDILNFHASIIFTFNTLVTYPYQIEDNNCYDT